MTYARSGLLAIQMDLILASQQLTLIRLALKLFSKLLARVEYLTRHLDYIAKTQRTTPKIICADIKFQACSRCGFTLNTLDKLN
jgi:hypothetical protein